MATAASTGSNVAAAQDIIHMSQVGGPRAALKLGNTAKARNYASQVPPS